MAVGGIIRNYEWSLAIAKAAAKQGLFIFGGSDIDAKKYDRHVLIEMPKLGSKISLVRLK